MEKKIDKHYSYKCGQDIGTNSSRNIGWFVVMKEHEPGKPPPFGQPPIDIKRGLSESDAKELVRRLETEELERRRKIEEQYPDIKQVADAAKKQAAQAAIPKLKAEQDQLEQRLASIKEEIRRNEEIISTVDNPS